MFKIIKGVKEIISAIGSIFGMIGTFFEMLFRVVQYLIHSVTIVLQIIGTLPTWISALAVVTLSISIIYMILGRKGGTSN